MYGFSRVEKRTSLIDICHQVVHNANYVYRDKKENIRNDLKEKRNGNLSRLMILMEYSFIRNKLGVFAIGLKISNTK